MLTSEDGHQAACASSIVVSSEYRTQSGGYIDLHFDLYEFNLPVKLKITIGLIPNYWKSIVTAVDS